MMAMSSWPTVSSRNSSRSNLYIIAVHTQRESRLTYAYGVTRLANG
jgi:hypothetical protein